MPELIYLSPLDKKVELLVTIRRTGREVLFVECLVSDGVRWLRDEVFYCIEDTLYSYIEAYAHDYRKL